MKNNGRLRKYVPSILLLLLFEAAAIVLWRVRDNLFYLLNFSYIGCCLALGTALFAAGKRYARHFVQLAVGGYMLLYLGVISRENMQIEGVWYYLFLGIASSALSKTTGGTDVQDFFTGILMGLSVVEILAGICVVGKTLLKQ